MPALRCMIAPPVAFTLPSVTTVEAVGGVIVIPAPGFGVQKDTPAGHPAFGWIASFVVGGSGLGAGGVGKLTACERYVIPPLISAPAEVAVTVPAAQLPTRARGVDSEPLISPPPL